MNRLKVITKVPFALVRNIVVFSFLLMLLPIWFPIVLVSNVIKFIIK